VAENVKSGSSHVGLQFPVSCTHRRLRKRQLYAERVGAEALVCVAIVIE